MWSETRYRKRQFKQAHAGKTLGTPMLETLTRGVNAKSGVCQELSGKWIRMIIKGEKRNSAERMSSLNTARSMRKAVVRHQRARTAERPTRAYPRSRAEMLETLVRHRFGYDAFTVPMLPRQRVAAIYGLRIDTFANIPWGEAATSIRSKGSIAMVTATFPAGYHAMACRGGAFTVEFFDPNKGEYHVPRVSFQKWFRDLLISYNYDIENARRSIEVIKYRHEIIARGNRRVQRLNMETSNTALGFLQSKGQNTHKGSFAIEELGESDLLEVLRIYGITAGSLGSADRKAFGRCFTTAEKNIIKPYVYPQRRAG